MDREHKWGFEPHHEAIWERMSTGDVLLFYVGKPVKGIVGFGRVANKKREETPFWSHECAQGKAIWPLRVYLDYVEVLPHDLWATKAVRIDRSVLVPRRALQLIRDDKASKLVDELHGALAKS
jgi:hypothetical protein